MIEPAITAEDLTLYAMHLLDSSATARVELLLRSSTEARDELSLIRGDLAAFAFSATQHTPPALSRQRLLKQVAREHRAVPIPVAMYEARPFAVDPAPVISDPSISTQRSARSLADERRSKVRLPRIVAEPEPLFSAEHHASHTQTEPSYTPPPPARSIASVDPIQQRVLPNSGPPAAPVRTRSIADPPPAAYTIPEDLPEDTYRPSTASLFRASAEPERRGLRLATLLAWTGWAAAAAMAAVGGVQFRNNLTLHDQLQTQTAQLSRTSAQAQRAEVVLQTLQSPLAQRFVLARQDTAPVPAARVTYLADHGSLVFQGTNLEPLQPYKTYELWLIPKGEGLQPIAAGTFKPDTRGYATLVLPSLPIGTVAGNFGVTIEDDGGSTAPTLPILLIGQQS